jgi:glucokinase
VSGPVLVGDVGGSNARFGLSDRPGQLRDVRSYQAAKHRSFEDAVRSYLAHVADGGAGFCCQAASIAAAGPVEAGQISLTNSPWRIDAEDLQAVIGGGTVSLFNDLEAVALVLPHLAESDMMRIGPAIAAPLKGNLLAVNVGTGLGAASAIDLADGRWTAVATEAGHMTYAARTEQEAELLSDVVSVEDILSGAGVVRLYELLKPDPKSEPKDATPTTAAEVFGLSSVDATASNALRIFSDLLARVTGNLVLAHGAWGGVFLCGSVAKGWSARANAERFREVFEAKGKMSNRMQQVSTKFILAPEPALAGLTYAGP